MEINNDLFSSLDNYQDNIEKKNKNIINLNITFDKNNNLKVDIQINDVNEKIEEWKKNCSSSKLE